MITFVWGEDAQGLIGDNGRLPWRLPADLKHFKSITNGDTVLMGRKTYDSLPIKPLPNRNNIILTRNASYQASGATVCHSVEEVNQLIASNEVVHIIGGAEIFRLFQDQVEMLYRTVIHDTFKGDTYMPPITYDQFQIVSKHNGTVDDANVYPHTFYCYKRVATPNGSTLL